MSAGRPALLVTGLPRSGTSWVGKMLEASGELVYVNEPLNPQHPPGCSPGVLNHRVTRRFQYISDDEDGSWRSAFADTMALRYNLLAELRHNRGAYDLARAAKYAASFTLGRLQGKRALLDDPFAVLSTRWLVQQMGAQAVVLVRDPVSFVGSWRALGWNIHFHELLEQPALVHDHLGAYVDQMRALIGSPDWLARICLLWRMVTQVVETSLRPLPDVQVLRYEDLVTAPLVSFQALYQAAGLAWTESAQARVRAATSRTTHETRSHAWSLRGGLSRTAYRPMTSTQALNSFQQRLSPQEIGRVRALTAEVAEQFPQHASPTPHDRRNRASK